MSGPTILDRIITACNDLHNAKVKAKKEGVDIISSLIDQLTEADLLNATSEDSNEQWNVIFSSVKTLLYKEVQKADDEITKKGKESATTASFIHECSSLLNKILENANNKDGVIRYTNYFEYLKDCCNDNGSFKKFCLNISLAGYRNYIIKRDIYWYNSTLENLTEIITLLKNQHLQDPTCTAINTYILILSKCAEYKLPLKTVKEEIKFMTELVKNIQSSENRSLLECAIQLCLVICQICGGTYKQLCMNEGEAALVHLFKFYNPQNNLGYFKQTLVELLMLQLQYHENIKANNNWTTVLLHTGSFIKKSLDYNDNVAVTQKGNVKQLNAKFLQVAVECYKQSCDANLQSVSSPNGKEPELKRAKLDAAFMEVIQKMESNINASWIPIFYEICEKYPQLINESYFKTLLVTFSNYVKGSKSIVLRGYVFNCLRVLIKVEEKLAKNNNEFVFNDSEWLQVYDSAIRASGLNQNLTECHNLLRELLKKKNHILTPVETCKLLSLYSSNTIAMSGNSLLTLNTCGNSCVTSKFNEITFKTVVIDSILQLSVPYKDRHLAYFSDSITAEVLVNLTFKYWINTTVVPASQAMGIINVESYDHLIQSLKVIVNDILEDTKGNYIMLLNCINLLACLVHRYRLHNVTDCSVTIVNILKQLACEAWKSLTTLFDSKSLSSSKMEPILEVLHKTLKLDEKIENVIKKTIEFPFIESFIKFQEDLAENGFRGDEADAKLKLLICKVLTTYSLRTDTETQKIVQEVLFEFDDFNAADDFDYAHAMIILKGLQNENCHLSVRSIDLMLQLIKKICNYRFTSYNCCLKILKRLKFVFLYLGRCKHVPQETQHEYFKIFKTLHDLRESYGYKFKLALVECFACIIACDKPLSWACYDNDQLVLLLPKYLHSESFELQQATVKVLVDIYRSNSCNVSLVDSMKNEIFKKVLLKLDSQIPAEEGDELNNFHQLVLYLFPNIMIVAKGTMFTKLSFCEMIVRAKSFKLSIGQLQKTIEKIQLEHAQFEIGNYLNALLHIWIKNHPLIEFPETLFGFTTKKEFYLKNISSLTLLLYQTEPEEFDRICQEIGKNQSEVLEECFPNFIARNIMLQASGDDKTNSSGSANVSFSNNLQQLKIDNLMTPEKRKQLTRSNLANILTDIVKYVYDPTHLIKMFKLDICTSKPEGNYISHKTFCKSVMDLLSADIGMDVVRYLLEKKTNNFQKILLNLKLNIWKKRNIEDKVLEFYRYALFLLRMLQNTLRDPELMTFIIRDVIYAMKNLIKHEEATMQVIALRFMGKFIDFLLPAYSKYFAEFIIVTCSSLVHHATSGNADALKILKSIIFSDNAHIIKNLKHLDPLPSNNNHVKDIRERHMKYRKKDNSLEEEIDLFLVGKQFKDCRTEGLKYLGKRLQGDFKGLKQIYQKLQNMRGVLSENSQMHSLICTLVSLVNSKDNKESMEAVKCLGILGANDLTTMVLKSEHNIQSLENSSYQFTNNVIKLLVNYLTDPNIEFVSHVSDALHVMLSSKEGMNVITNDPYFTSIQGYLLPFLALIAKDQNLLAIKAELYNETLHDSMLWCPESDDHEKWIKTLVTKILEGFDNQNYIKWLIPIVFYKPTFAEECFPYLLNLLMDTNARVKRMLGVCIRSFFQDHWNSRQNNSVNTVTMNKRSIKCLLNAIHYIGLHRLCDKKGYYRELELDINYLHLAYAAQYCSAHFSALMYSEKWYQTVINTKEVTNTGKSFFSEDEMEEEMKILQKILAETYNAIGDKYALYGGHFENDFISNNLDYNLDNLLHCDIKMLSNTENAKAMTKTLKDYSLYNLAVKTETYGDAYYEAMWRLSQWNVTETAQQSDSFEFNIYNLLNTLNDQNKSTFESLIKSTRQQIAASLKNISLESCKTLYGPLSELERLHELEGIFNVAIAKSDLLPIFNTFTEKDEIRSDFEYFEPRLAQRIEAIGLLNKRQYAGANDIHLDLRLKLADVARDNGNLLLCKRILSNLTHIENEEIQAKVCLMEAQIHWELGNTTAISCLKKLLRNYTSDTRLRSTILKLCGVWMYENQYEYPHKIIADYLIPSVETLHNLNSDDSQTMQMLNETYNTLAKFADEQYQSVNKTIKSPEFECKVKTIEKLKNAALKLRNIQRPGDDIKKAAVTYERFTRIDENDVNAKHQERVTFLNIAMKYYLLHLKYTKTVSTEIFRILSLWLDNKTDANLCTEIEENLLNIETYKIIPILPQLVPHISTEQDRFSKCIFELIKQSAIQHPHHAIPMVQSVANTNNDDAYSKDNAKTCSNENRIKGAKYLITELSKVANLEKIINENEVISSAFIELAYYKGIKSKDTVKIPRNLKIYNVKNMAALLPTYNLPVMTNLDYSNIVGIHKLKMEYTLVGGINAPKRMECIGSDGIIRYLLIKGKDDLRQDAVMQQVFVIMNELLKMNKETENLRIRTYKIVPLSKRSGVLEWVSNTMPIGMYLIDAHKHYYPMDLTPDKAIKELEAAVNTSPSNKLKVFNNICKRMHPVFHKFFVTNFLEPTVWFEKRRVYTQSVATSSMCGYILGIGDRHVQNILIDKTTAEVIHIDFGIAFEQGRILPTPETVPFRLTRDIVDGMGLCGVEGTFRKTCEKTIEVLRKNMITIQTILEVLLYDPLYVWSISTTQAYSKQMDEDGESEIFSVDDEETEINVSAERALTRLRQKLLGTEFSNRSTVESQVERLIQESRAPSNLSKLFRGWQAFL